MKLSEKNLQLFIILLIVVVGFGAYQFGYSSFKKKADKQKLENQLTVARIAELTGKEAKRSEYVETINGAGEQINEILAKYGAVGSKEKTIMFVSRLESEASAQVSSIGFTDDQAIYSSSTVDDAGVPVIRGYKKQVTIEYSCLYENMKRLFSFVANYPERANIDSFSMMYNQENGGVNGSLIINEYAVEDANHEYEAPSVTGVPLGKDNIFD
jgi:hypothetical protein